MKAVVARQELLAALIFASQDGDRYTLQSVYIELRPGCKPVIVSTDGRRLVVIETNAEQMEDYTREHSILLRSEFVKAICALSKAMGGKLFPWISFENKQGSDRVFVEFIGGACILESESGALVEGAFPNWRACLPAKKKGTPINEIGLNPEFVGDFAKVIKVMEGKNHVIQMNLVGKEQQVEVKIPCLSNFYGLVMQCKLDESVEYQPEFLGIIKDLPPPAKEEKEKGDETTVEIRTNGYSTGKMPIDKFTAAAKKLSENGNGNGHVDEEEDLIQNCLQVIMSEKRASVSLFQRRLRLGYTRAAKIMDELERRGIVGPSKGAEPRDILVATE